MELMEHKLESEIRLEPPPLSSSDFGFPFTPYDIQKEFMTAVAGEADDEVGVDVDTHNDTNAVEVYRRAGMRPLGAADQWYLSPA